MSNAIPPLTPEQIQAIRGSRSLAAMARIFERHRSQIGHWETGFRQPSDYEATILRAMMEGDEGRALDALEARFQELRREIIQYFREGSGENA